MLLKEDFKGRLVSGLRGMGVRKDEEEEKEEEEEKTLKLMVGAWGNSWERAKLRER